MAAATHPAAVFRSVGHERRTTIPAWMITGTGETAHAPAGSQEQLSVGEWQEGGRAPAIVAIHPTEAQPPMGRGGG